MLRTAMLPCLGSQLQNQVLEFNGVDPQMSTDNRWKSACVELVCPFIKGMDWKCRLKVQDIHDTLYFEPCNFTLNPFQDFELTCFKREQKRVCNYRLFKLFNPLLKLFNVNLLR